MSLKIDNKIITDAQFEYIGCAGLQACASAMTEMIKRKDIVRENQLQVDDIISYLKGIPESKYDRVEIARVTLRLVLDEYLSSL